MGERGRRLTERYERDETVAHRLDRNYGELLQELRVAQTGVQVLFAFLLGIGFQQRFTTLTAPEKALYVVTLVSAATAALLLIAPAAVHRVLFGQHRKGEIVVITGRLAACGLTFLAVSVLTAVLLVVTFVVNFGAALAIAGMLGLLVVMVWIVVPLAVRRSPNNEIEPPA